MFESKGPKLPVGSWSNVEEKSFSYQHYQLPTTFEVLDAHPFENYADAHQNWIMKPQKIGVNIQTKMFQVAHHLATWKVRVFSPIKGGNFRSTGTRGLRRACLFSKDTSAQGLGVVAHHAHVAPWIV